MIGPLMLNLKSVLLLRTGSKPMKIVSPFFSLFVRYVEYAEFKLPEKLLLPSLVTALTTPLIAFPYSALNVPVITSRSFTASTSKFETATTPPKASFTGTPSII